MPAMRLSAGSRTLPSVVELYSSVLKLAPLMLLKLLDMGAFEFSKQDRDKYRRITLAGDVTLVISVMVGGFVAALVLSDMMPPTTTTRWSVVLAGCLSLLLLAAHMLREIAALHIARTRAKSLAAAGSSGQAV